MKIKKLLVLALVAMMLVPVFANGTKEDAVAAKAEDLPVSITVPENWDFSVGFYPVMTPMVGSNYGSGYWTCNFYDTLVKYDENGKIVGSLAESWEISEDGKTYTFHLRDGVKFSDGTPLTSDAVKQSLQAVVTHLGPMNGTYGKLTTLFGEMETPDEKTFILHLASPYYAALNDLTMCLPMGIVNPKTFEGGVDKAYANCVNATMGTGPYMFAGMDGDAYRFTLNPYYWGETPEVAEFKVKVIPDNATKVLALRNGEIDAILGSSRMSSEGFTELSQSAGFSGAVNAGTTQTRYLALNLNKAPFNDPLVREALSYAIDQQELETAVFDGLETAAEKLFSNEKAYCDVDVKTYATDMDKARSLMNKAGYADTDGDGFLEKEGAKLTVHFCYSQSLASIDNAALAITASLKDLGFDVIIDAVDMMTWYGNLMAGNYDMALYNTSGGAFDPAANITNMGPAGMGDPVLAQFSAFIDPALFVELDSTADTERVQELYEVILKTIAEDNLLIPLTGTHDLAVWNSEVISGYGFHSDPSYVNISAIKVN